MPKEVEECVASVMEDNPEMDESRAWAICQDQFDESKLGQVRDRLGLSEEELVEMMKLLGDSDE